MGLVSRLRGTNWPQLGSVHKNGDRVVGRDSPTAAVLYQAGTPPMWALHRASVNLAVVPRAAIDDRYLVTFDGERWWCEIDGEQAGRLNWSLKDEARGHLGLDMPLRYPRSGELLVTRLIVNASNEIVNFGGIVYPA